MAAMFMFCSGRRQASIAHEHKSLTRAKEVQAEAKDLGKQGRPRKDAEEKGSHDTNLLRGSGNAEYIAARIKRDHPDIAAAVARGEPVHR